MLFRASIIFCALLLTLASGCASRSLVAERSAQIPRASTIVAPPAPVTEFTLSSEFVLLADHHDRQEEEYSDMLVLPKPAPRVVAEKKSEPPAPTAKPTEEVPSARLNKVAGPRADDRLLDLVDKDLDKAVGQSIEPRRLQFSKAVIDDPKVREFIKYFSKDARQHFAQLLSRSGKYMPMIGAALREAGLPEELGYLALIESGFASHTTSAAGAAGLWQFVPATARRYGLRIDSWIDERRDPLKSTRAAAAYLKQLHNYYGRWFLTTAAYNAGQGMLDQALQKSPSTDYRSLRDNPQLSAETRNFVPKFVAAALIAAEPHKYGFDNLRYETPLKYDEVEVRASVKLETIAALTGSDVNLVTELNPALLRGQTPPGEANFRVRIPEGRTLLLAKAPELKLENVEAAKEPADSEMITHEVKRGETLFLIARRYGQNVRALMQLNGLATPNLRVGQQLKVWVDALRGAIR